MMTAPQTAGLFGLNHSNRDFTKPKSWGKNQFNSAFPAALCCYMGHNGLEPVYLQLDTDRHIKQGYIRIDDLLGLKPLDPHLFFSFESVYSPYEVFVVGKCPAVDLVTMNTASGKATTIHPLEIKLTALPDNQTCDFAEELYSCELVVRPQTIAYLALSVIQTYHPTRRGRLGQLLDPVCRGVSDWRDPSVTRPKLVAFVEGLDSVLMEIIDEQTPLLVQPVWKTKGKSPILHEQCLDIFVWSNLGLTRLFVDKALSSTYHNTTRPERSVVWLVKMLYDYAVEGRFDFGRIKDEITYNTGNDKAFSIGGKETHKYLRGAELTTPRIPQSAFKAIILGGGQNYLSPERRLDAIILNTPRLFA